MDGVPVQGIVVPRAVARSFSKSTSPPYQFGAVPFSYSRPNPGVPPAHLRISVPRVLPVAVEDEPIEMAQTAVHLQYNSPLNIYSKASAEEQLEQQVGGIENAGSIPLPVPEKQFDPSKSATLRYLQEGGGDEFGKDFFAKVAAAEQRRVPAHREPHWVQTAREKSERARSKTPADPQPRNSRWDFAPSSHPVHYDTWKDHIDKNRTFTHLTHSNDFGPSYYNVQRRGRRGQSEPRDRNSRGYELGGIDYTKGLYFGSAADDYDYYPPRRQRSQEPQRARPGYEMGGTDFGRGYISSGPYHGHGPDPPRLRPKYTADPRSACNSFVAPNIDVVNANLLVGDTLSNQKIRHEVRHIDQSEFGTSFAPTAGFKRDHVTVNRAQPPQDPVTFSLSARKGTVPMSSAPPEQHNVWTQRQSDSEREVYVTEPNWSRNVSQRKNAWERKAYETDARVSLPASAKVRPTAPPSWTTQAKHTHNVWQNAADTMQSPPTTQQQSYQQQSQQQSQQSQQQLQYASDGGLSSPGSRHESYRYESYSSTNQAQPPQAGQFVSDTNAAQQVNSGYNANQMDYVRSHQDRYQGGQQYADSQQANYNQNYTTTTTTTTTNGGAIPLGPPQSAAGQNYSTYTETKSSSQTHDVPVNAGNFVSYNTQTTGNNTQGANYTEKSSSYKKTVREETSTTGGTTVPVVPVASTQQQESRSNRSSFTQQQMTQPFQQLSIQPFQTYQQNTQRSSQVQSYPQPMMHSPAGSYKSEYSSSHYSKQEKTTTTTNQQQQPTSYVNQISHTPVTQNTTYSYTQQSVPAQQQPASMQQSSFTSHSEQKTSSVPPQAVPASSYQYERHNSSRREEREETSRPVSQLSQYSESRNFKRNFEEKTETKTVPGQTVYSSGNQNLSTAEGIESVFNRKEEMNEKLPHGSISNTHNNTQGNYRDVEGHDVSYKRDLSTSANPGKEYSLLKEEEKRVVETPLEPGVISRHVTTKYYKKKTVTDTTTTTNGVPDQQ